MSTGEDTATLSATHGYKQLDNERCFSTINQPSDHAIQQHSAHYSLAPLEVQPASAFCVNNITLNGHETFTIILWTMFLG